MGKYVKGDVVLIRDDASGEYAGRKGVVVSLPTASDEFFGVSLVSNNGSRGVWAVHKDEILEKVK